MSIDQQQPVHVETQVSVQPLAGTRPVRHWLAAVPVAAYWGFMFVSDRLEWPTFLRFGSRIIVGLSLALFTLIWWWVNRRTSLRERAFGFAVFLIGGIIAVPLCDRSTGVAGAGLIMGPLAVVLSAWILAAVLTGRSSPSVRRLALVVAISCAWISLAVVRLEGLSGELRPEMHWRWTPSAEDEFRAERAQSAHPIEAKSVAAEGRSVKEKPGDWPGFRGPNGDATVHGTSIRTNWDADPPQLVWRHRVGPAWSSLIVVDGRVYTQEQCDQQESAVCYSADTGAELWCHGDDVRFSEETAGPGPRATPCFADGKLFTLGCTGILDCLDAATGKVNWSHDLANEYGASVPHWGYTSSPVVVGGRVVVFAAGPDGKNLLAYDAKTGELQWAAPSGETSYASPQLLTVSGTPQVLMLTNRGMTAVEPATGVVLWEHLAQVTKDAPRSVQPAAFGESGVLMGSEDLGVLSLELTHQANTWSADQRWASKSLKPAFNDFVVAQGHAFGFDGRIFACVDLETGNRRWKDGRYGEGQVILLADQGLLLVVSEKGEVILLRANPQRHELLARFQGIHGKTWTHPALVRGKLYLRNSEEMACYDLASGDAK
jgi:outer membrane protein assembly factor BamB